ncbi:DNA polymerase III subunit epsilon [Amia ocellicauda]|uniref:DNA polymerase III subunit epsilon n=1 Tax=Amia ocellicauda TaxID=2972642 RepID=UPI0034642C08
MDFEPQRNGCTAQGQSEYTFVFFDLETTGLDVSVCDIIQLSAISGERTLNVYMLPRCNMTEEASRITGFTVEDSTLLLHGQPVETMTHKEALTYFMTFLRNLHQPLLVAHNGKRFDCPVLARTLDEFSLRDDFKQVMCGFLDTFLLSKALFTDLRKFSQEYLVKYFLGKSYMAHNALEDVKALQELYKAWSPTSSVVHRHRFT